MFLRVSKVDAFCFTIEQDYFRFLLQICNCKKKKKNGSSVFKTVFRVFNMQFGFECTVDSQGNINLVGGAVLVVVDLRY